MGQPTTHRPVWRLGRVIPCLLVVVFLADLVSRVPSIDPLTFRAWEAMSRNRPPGAAFEPNRRYVNARAYGDLASFGNLPAMRQYRPEVFTTDALGFRNPPHVLGGEVSAILIGDSFAVGSGVSDDETLSSRLTKITGCVVYNAGSDLGRVVPKEVLALARRLHLRNHLVMRLYAEDAAVPPMPTRRERLLWDLEARMPARLRALIGRLRGLAAVGPLQVLSGRAVKALEDDRILPNRYAGYVVRATLDNGDPMLFQASEVNNFYRRREVRLDYWQWLRDTLRPAGFDLLVVLVPSKYTVYRPFLVDQRPGPGAGADYLDRLEQDLRAAGIPVLNLTPLTSAEAARDLRYDRYLYWLDDIHWNARGIALAAGAIRERWPLADAPCSTTLSRAVEKP